MKKIIKVLCIVVLVSLIFFPSFISKPNLKAEPLDLYLEIQQNSFSRAPSKRVFLPVTLGNLKSDNDILIKSIEILDEDKNLIQEEKIEKVLKSIYEFSKTSCEVRKTLGINPPDIEDIKKAKELLIEAEKEKDKKKKEPLVYDAFLRLKYKDNLKHPDSYSEDELKLVNLLYGKYIEVDLLKIVKDIEEVDFVRVLVKINYEMDKQTYSTQQEVYLFYLAALPTRTGWYPGDGHIHTQGLSAQPDSPSNYSGNYENYGFSDATDSSTILVRRNQANSFGYKWIIITDHAGDDAHPTTPSGQARLESDEWSIYNQACTRATNNYSPNITVCPGEELATVEGSSLPPNRGHLLCYSNSSYASSYGTCQDLINRTNSAGGFGVIAHPYNQFGFGWGDWNVSGFRGLEIINNQSSFSENAVNKWDELLTNNLQGIINGSYPKIIGMANSDVHNSSYQWGYNMNYIYTGSSSPPGTNRSAVYDNLKAGRVSASSDGSLAVFSLNGYAPGSIVNVSPGSNNISITVSGKCVLTGSTNIEIRIKSNNGTTVYTDAFSDSDTDFTKTYTLSATNDRYYRVEVTFYTASGTPTSYCFVNPVYVNLP